MTFAYGPERARYKRTDTSGTNTTTTLYVGSVEKVTHSSSLYEYKRYIAGGAALITEKHATTVENGVSTETETVTTQYLLKDHLGSVAVITNALGGVDQELSYDAWGQRRNAATWGDLTAMAKMSFDVSRTTRGFTGHEMVDAVGIIHMNGRIYDPNLGRFMQADPVIQFPDFSQSHNRYSYVLNNPLAYTDPSGYFPVFTALAVVGLIAADITSKIIIAAVIGTAVFADSLAQGVPLDKAFLAGVSAGALTAVALGTFPTGNFGLNLATAGHVATVATVGGITTSLQGGKFGHGFLSAGIGASVGGIPALRGVSAGRVAARTVVSAVSAGTVSEITGGKFANGAVTAAFFSLVSSAAQAASADNNLTTQQQAAEAQRKREEVYVTGHKIGGVGPVHTAIEYTDANGVPVTISAGPDDGLLVSETGRLSDRPEKNFTIGTVSPPPGISAQQYIRTLRNTDAIYCDCVDYDLFPSIGDGYNSNSYIHGLIQSTGGSIPIDFGNYIGGNNPLPAGYFQR